MAEEKLSCKDDKTSLHHARRKFFKQSAALTAIALTPPSLIKASGNNFR